MLPRDLVDLFLEQWARERPDLDVSALGVVSRILALYKALELAGDRALGPFGLTLWQFDVLTALRRSGPPFRLSPTRLMELVTLSSGAMTHRIDRLEEMQLVRRDADPDDRRGVLISLTAKGRRLVDQAIVARLEAARSETAALSALEQERLATLLRKLLLAHDLRAPEVDPP